MNDIDRIVQQACGNAEDSDSLMNGTVARRAARLAYEDAAKVAEHEEGANYLMMKRFEDAGNDVDASIYRSSYYTSRRIALAIRAKLGK